MTTFCCKPLQKAIEEFDGPFSTPIGYDPESRQFVTVGLTVAMYHLTPSRKAIAAGGRERWILDYCPFCGQKVERES